MPRADKRAHLYRLAKREPPAAPSDPVPTSALKGTLDALCPHPAAVLNDRFDILAGNPAFDAVFPGAQASGNTLRWMFTDPFARLVIEEWEREAGLTVGNLRHYAADPREPPNLQQLLEELNEQPDFHRLWTTGRVVADRPDPAIRLRNPRTGAVHTTLLQQFHIMGRSGRARMLVGVLTDVTAAQ